MKIAYLCAMAHVTVIEKPEGLKGSYPGRIQCTCPHCLTDAILFTESVMSEEVVATHIFYNVSGELISLQEQEYLKAGGLLFKEIPENIAISVKNEFRNSKELLRLAEFLVNTVDVKDRIGTPVDTAIDQIEKFKELQLANLKFIRNQKLRMN